MAADLRRVVVLEHDVVPVHSSHDSALARVSRLEGASPWLLVSEARRALEINEVRRGFCDWTLGGVRFSNHCGIVNLGSCLVEILPKVGHSREPGRGGEADQARRALLRMLHCAGAIRIDELESAPQTVSECALLDVFIRAFLQCALEQARRGLIFRYVAAQDDLPIVRGRIVDATPVRRGLYRPHLIACAFDDFSADNPFNRAVRATLEVIRYWIRGNDTRRLWMEAFARFHHVTPIRITAEAVAQLPRNRTTRRYGPLLAWCEWLLALLSPNMSAGQAAAPGLLFDMNRLFESFVASREESAVSAPQWIQRQGPRQALAKVDGEDIGQLRPDVTVWTRDALTGAPRIVRIVDAKWKQLDPCKTGTGVSQADLNQMLAYGLAYGCRHLELVYPTAGEGATGCPLPRIDFVLPEGSGLEGMAVQIRAIHVD